MKKRKQYSPAFKAKIALLAYKEELTPAQIASEYEVHPTLVNKWRRELEEHCAQLFEDGRKASAPANLDEVTAPLYQQIGQLKVDNDFLRVACQRLGLKPGKGC